MPRNVRNFWIEGRIDGRITPVTGGPVGANGGFTMTIYMRDEGKIVNALDITGRCLSDGRLVLTIESDEAIHYLSSGEWRITTER